MNRADRRRQQRDVNKNQVVVSKDNLRSLFSKFNDKDLMLIERVVQNRVKSVLEESSSILDMIYTAKLSDMGLTWEEASKFNNEVVKIFREDQERLQEIEKEFGEESGFKMAKMAAEVEERIGELIKDGMLRKDVIETILYEFPKLTKSMATSTYSKVQSDLKKELKTEDPLDDKDLKDIGNYIFGEDEKVKDKKDDFQEKTEKAFKNEEVELTGATVEQANLNPTAENKGLKIKSMVVEGENGVYRVCSEGVELKNEGLLMFFENPEQLDNFYKEYKQAFDMLKA